MKKLITLLIYINFQTQILGIQKNGHILLDEIKRRSSTPDKGVVLYQTSNGRNFMISGGKDKGTGSSEKGETIEAFTQLRKTEIILTLGGNTVERVKALNEMIALYYPEKCKLPAATDLLDAEKIKTALALPINVGLKMLFGGKDNSETNLRGGDTEEVLTQYRKRYSEGEITRIAPEYNTNQMIVIDLLNMQHLGTDKNVFKRTLILNIPIYSYIKHAKKKMIDYLKLEEFFDKNGRDKSPYSVQIEMEVNVKENTKSVITMVNGNLIVLFVTDNIKILKVKQIYNGDIINFYDIITFIMCIVQIIFALHKDPKQEIILLTTLIFVVIVLFNSLNQTIHAWNATYALSSTVALGIRAIYLKDKKNHSWNGEFQIVMNWSLYLMRYGTTENATIELIFNIISITTCLLTLQKGYKYGSLYLMYLNIGQVLIDLKRIGIWHDSSSLNSYYRHTCFIRGLWPPEIGPTLFPLYLEGVMERLTIGYEDLAKMKIWIISAHSLAQMCFVMLPILYICYSKGWKRSNAIAWFCTTMALCSSTLSNVPKHEHIIVRILTLCSAMILLLSVGMQTEEAEGLFSKLDENPIKANQTEESLLRKEDVIGFVKEAFAEEAKVKLQRKNAKKDQSGKSKGSKDTEPADNASNVHKVHPAKDINITA